MIGCVILQSKARVNTVATTSPCFQATRLFVTAKLLHLVVATLFGHQDLNIFLIISGPRGSFMLSCCPCREAIKLSRAQLCHFGKYQFFRRRQLFLAVGNRSNAADNILNLNKKCCISFSSRVLVFTSPDNYSGITVRRT